MVKMMNFKLYVLFFFKVNKFVVICDSSYGK